MLPVYNALQFKSILRLGGRTQPWLVVVNEEGRPVVYVVKMFSYTEIQNRDSVTNEVIGNVLAREFNLNVPKAALIELDEDFLITIDNPQAEETFYNTDDRIKFGSQFLYPAYEYKYGSYSSQEIKSLCEIDSVFAFDILIRNGDRTNRKPNFLIHNKKGFIIDHELGLNITSESAARAFRYDFSFQYHIFYDFLRHSWKSNKNDFFMEFLEYLRLLNVNNLNSYFQQLSNYGFSNNKHLDIINYLLEMKAKSANFGILLRNLTG